MKIPFKSTKLVCPKCGTVNTICRKRNKQKKAGHKKWLWCYKCKDTINHIELGNKFYDFELFPDKNDNHILQ